MSAVAASPKIDLNPSSERGYADHGWLTSYHTFSFANWYNPSRQSYSSLRVINEDRVAGGGGFPAHGHRDFEIFSYVLSGRLLHRDSLGNSEVIGRGGIQFTSAGTGIRHSEFNAEERGGEDVRFLQVWLQPTAKGLAPSYTNKEFADEHKINQLKLIISHDGRDDSVRINQDVLIYASILEEGQSVEYKVREGRRAYVHLAMQSGTMAVNGVALKEGDGAFISGAGDLRFTGVTGKPEFLLFDLVDAAE